MSDIVQLLRELAECKHSDLSVASDGADEIEALRAEVEQLRAVLESIADLPPGYADMRQDDLVVILANKARAALEERTCP